ncbi:MAG TPA: type 1 glutamine amidotransferase [Gaiellaceae bacterium]|nr:type 1 glutamine amidotransferase [Gaiellaceae bacterium]
MNVLVLQHIACEPPGVYEDVLREHGAALHRVEVDAGDDLPDWRNFDAIVAMGGPMSANDDAEHPWLADEKRLIADAARAGMPFWGVCLGVQLLAASLGARVYAGDEPEVGVLPVELTEEGRSDPVFSAMPPSLPALQWHGDTFDLPPGAVRLAGSPAYPNQAFRFENAYGVQFHLEVSGEMAREWTDVPEYANALDRTIGSEAMLRAVDERVDEMLDHGRTLLARWLDSVVRTSSFDAVRLEA